jgi:DNA-binding response OmpR family regulator
MDQMAGLVLVVEDEQSLREALEHLLRHRHFEVISAETVDKALNLLGTRRPDAAIVDLQLNGRSGREVIARVPANVPIIIFSGMTSLCGELERLRPRTRLVEKPCSLTWLIDNLVDMLVGTAAYARCGRPA